MRAYVINMARSADRRAHMLAELDRVKVDYVVVPAVDGRDLDVSDPDVVDPAVLASDWFRPGVAGCALSHLGAYRRIVADRQDCALVLEDDVQLPDDLTDLLDDLAKQLCGAEVVLLNYDSPERCLLSRSGALRLRSGRQLVLPLDAGQPNSGAGYIITGEACRRIAEMVPPVRAKADDWGRFYRAGAIDRLRCVVPLPVIKHPAFASTMAYHAPHSLKARVLAAVTRYQIGPLLRVIARRRERILRHWTRIELSDAPFIENPSRLG